MTKIEEFKKLNNTTFVRPNNIRQTIENNDPIEDKLNVIAVISNPCLYKRRYQLIHEFIERIEKFEPNVRLFIVELAYGTQEFVITNKNNKNHLQLRTETPLWHKENMVNLGVKYLLPNDWKAFAWVDADIEFEDNLWAINTLKILNGSADIVQLFSHCIDLGVKYETLQVHTGIMYAYCNGEKYITPKKYGNYFHVGYDWDITR